MGGWTDSRQAICGDVAAGRIDLYIEGPANSFCSARANRGHEPDEAGEYSSEGDAGQLDRGERISRGEFVAAAADFARNAHRPGGCARRQHGGGARKAFAEIAEGERERWLKIPFTGCDGLPKTGQAWIRNGLLTATIYIRPNTDLGLEMLTEAIRTGMQPPERKLIAPESVPSLKELAARTAKSESENAYRSAGA